MKELLLRFLLRWHEAQAVITRKDGFSMQLYQETFGLKGVTTFDLDRIPTNCTIKRGSEGVATVSITGPERYKDEVEVGFVENTISIRGPKSYVGGIGVRSSGLSFVRARARTIEMTGGRIIVDGRDISADQENSAAEPPLDFVLTIPDGSDLRLQSVGRLECEPDVNRVLLNLCGQSLAEIGVAADVGGSISGQSALELKRYTGEWLRVDLSGQSGLEVEQVQGCALQLSISGQSRVSVDGEFSEIGLELSGQSTCRTNGAVAGDFSVSAKGMSSVKHRGGVAGEVFKKSKGMSTVVVA